ncbi:hypothetical protein M758_12G156800 [Ceratodon purpureus]|uniref:Uncharacterized protein n=1 Tax=Ceratodon purpureus TaxID=3225 RepID=A0A8T0G8Z3_CERPU|nr:hypothetical protein KC19_12G154400 [Ceratodon purpureus]KAG0599501.1 hypothetical protein M758_12G156800 [Ceratodon purpureus]
MEACLRNLSLPLNSLSPKMSQGHQAYHQCGLLMIHMKVEGGRMEACLCNLSLRLNSLSPKVLQGHQAYHQCCLLMRHTRRKGGRKEAGAVACLHILSLHINQLKVSCVHLSCRNIAIVFLSVFLDTLLSFRYFTEQTSPYNCVCFHCDVLWLCPFILQILLITIRANSRLLILF